MASHRHWPWPIMTHTEDTSAAPACGCTPALGRPPFARLASSPMDTTQAAVLQGRLRRAASSERAPLRAVAPTRRQEPTWQVEAAPPQRGGLLSQGRPGLGRTARPPAPRALPRARPRRSTPSTCRTRGSSHPGCPGPGWQRDRTRRAPVSWTPRTGPYLPLQAASEYRVPVRVKLSGRVTPPRRRLCLARGDSEPTVGRIDARPSVDVSVRSRPLRRAD